MNGKHLGCLGNLMFCVLIMPVTELLLVTMWEQCHFACHLFAALPLLDWM